MGRFKDLEFMWAGGSVRRFHTQRTLLEDTVGHHSYNVASIIMVLRPDAPARLLRAALKHDAAEHKLGDVPAPAKRSFPDVVQPHGAVTSFRDFFGAMEDQHSAAAGVCPEALNVDEKWLLKFADSIDGLRFCIQEMNMGNRAPPMVEAAKNFFAYVTDLIGSDCAQSVDRQLYTFMQEKYDDACYPPFSK